MALKKWQLRLVYAVVLLTVLILLSKNIGSSISGRTEKFVSKWNSLTMDQVQKVVIRRVPLEESKGERFIELNREEAQVLLRRVIGQVSFQRLGDRLLPENIFECRIFISDGTTLCFEAIQSTTRGPVLSFYTGCLEGYHLGVMKDSLGVITSIETRFSVSAESP